MMAPGDPIVWTESLDSPDTIQRGTVTRLLGDYVQYGTKIEDSIYRAFVFPAAAETRLVEVLTKRQELKKAYDDSMKLIYELRNAVTRGEV